MTLNGLQEKYNVYFVKGSRILYSLRTQTIDHRSASTAAYPLNVLQTRQPAAGRPPARALRETP